jgi:hypothetical protein
MGAVVEKNVEQFKYRGDTVGSSKTKIHFDFIFFNFTPFPFSFSVHVRTLALILFLIRWRRWCIHWVRIVCRATADWLLNTGRRVKRGIDGGRWTSPFGRRRQPPRRWVQPPWICATGLGPRLGPRVCSCGQSCLGKTSRRGG